MYLERGKFQKGFNLVEVMVSVFLMAIGILGVVSMQVSSVKVNQGAYNQSQANILMTEILDRMRLNRTAFLNGDYDGKSTETTAPAAQDCIADSGGCNGAQLALHDIRAFSGFFNDVDAAGDNFIPYIPGGTAVITRDALTDIATVVVSWEQEEWAEVESEMVKSVSAQQLSISVRI